MATRAELEAVIVARLGVAMSAVGMDGAGKVGINESLGDPLAYAMRLTGYTVASIVEPTDAEVAAITAEHLDRVIDIAELRAVETVLMSATAMVDIRVGPRDEKLSQMATRLEALAKAKRDYVGRRWGIAGLVAGETGPSEIVSLTRVD